MIERGFALGVCLALAAHIAAAKGPADAPALPPSSLSSPAMRTTPDESQLVEHGSYRNSSGDIVHSPAHSMTGTVPSGASARCRDSTYSFSQHRSGTCSGHGGVAEWL